MTKPRPLTTEEPWVKPVEDWPCHDCSCTYVATDGLTKLTDPDPRCHVHSFHGRRGCVSHDITPAGCDCGGCGIDPVLEQARHAEYVARGARFEANLPPAYDIPPVDTRDTKEGLEALKAAKAKVAAEQAAAQADVLQLAIQAAVDAALAKQADAT
jgi:hypothetical protein